VFQEAWLAATPAIEQWFRRIFFVWLSLLGPARVAGQDNERSVGASKFINTGS
jgi:hypothetical protein